MYDSLETTDSCSRVIKLKTFNFDEISTMERKDTKKVLEYMQNEIPNTFVKMSELTSKFGSNARTHIKGLEGKITFRIKRFDKNGTSKKETEFWTYVVAELLDQQQLEALTFLLRTEKDSYSNVVFEVIPKPTVTKKVTKKKSKTS